ncbi:uncharacterized protein N7477_004445 [Penicillium maclennaniae]|uniref:uncharacterized protein n=1 Tax=Penicillium maclennaniae TaxID=1343394 RepID=UPI002540AD6C|nr:uncharacterized protein N7477_004445 [Penicillium maclennaniae]KAJ5674511.1 hypothetical protein N7477_004445 [Penicillium maclennaniae]
MLSATPYTFTHSDLTNVNIMLDNGSLAGILDWEPSGYFPVRWEFTYTGIEWKDLLRKYLPDYTKAGNFRLDFFALRKYPNLDEGGLSFLNSRGLSLPVKAQE